MSLSTCLLFQRVSPGSSWWGVCPQTNRHGARGIAKNLYSYLPGGCRWRGREETRAQHGAFETSNPIQPHDTSPPTRSHLLIFPMNSPTKKHWIYVPKGDISIHTTTTWDNRTLIIDQRLNTESFLALKGDMTCFPQRSWDYSLARDILVKNKDVIPSELIQMGLSITWVESCLFQDL